MNLLTALRDLFRPILEQISPDPSKVADYLAMIRQAQNPDHGDYQANFAMPLAKALKRKPPEVAAEVIQKLPTSGMVESATVAGPGFINLKLKNEWLAKQAQTMAGDDQLGIAPAGSPKTFVIDYSSPNVAKPLHVGHLRSTIIGEALKRILTFLGHKVIGDNHLGDWGTQFGILLYGYKNFRDDTAFKADPVRELARLYIHVRKLCKKSDDDDDEAATGDPIENAYREETAKLHAGDAENVALWKMFMPACLEMLRPIYDRLDVHIEHAHGESFYHLMLPGVVDEMLATKLAVESAGAVVIPNAKGVIPQTEEERLREDPPAILRKRDGAFTYTTSDLATIKYRVSTWHPDAMLYVVGTPQSLHFKTLFAQARRWGYDKIEFQHINFGSVLGKDKKMFAARKGGAIELMELLDEAAKLGLEKYEANAAERLTHGHKVPSLSPEEKQLIAETVGVGAVKYADLSQNRTSDYVFDYDKMLATVGNTATYMQYAYARCRAIFREGNVDESRFRSSPPKLLLTNASERSLALQLLRLPEAIEAAAADYLPHLLTGFLWDLAKGANVFYEECPVLKAESTELKDSRLLLVDLVGRVIKQTLDLLGIRVVERM
jgi:arginyl-tRNA synthetase